MAEATATTTGPASPIDRRSLVFWVVVLATTYGALRLGGNLALAFLGDPIGFVVAIVLWTAYGLVFLWFLVAHEMLGRRPRGTVVAALVWGSVTAAGIAIYANKAMDEILVRVTSPDVMVTWGAALTAPIVEESLKITGVVALALVAPRAIRSTADGLFYGVLVGLGFEVLEDIIYSMAGGGVGGVVGNLLLRGLLGGLWSHAVYTGIAGAGVGYFISRTDRSRGERLLVAVGLFLAAVALHFLWDSPLLSGGSGAGVLTFSAILLKGIPALVLLLLLIRWSRRRERREFELLTSTTVDPRVIRPADVAELETRRRRKRVRKRTRKELGRKARGIRRRLQYAQLDYVRAVRDDGPDSPYAVGLADIIGKRYDALDTMTTARQQHEGGQ